MLEIVLLQDVLSSYASNWLRMATTTGADTIKQGDVFRERGFGEGAEELLVDALDISPIPGGSRILFRRCHHSTKPQSYRMGAVLLRISEEVMHHAEPVPDVHMTAGAQHPAEAPAPKTRRARVPAAAAVPDLLSDV